jgi:hypothetical protein
MPTDVYISTKQDVFVNIILYLVCENEWRNELINGFEPYSLLIYLVLLFALYTVMHILRYGMDPKHMIHNFNIGTNM